MITQCSIRHLYTLSVSQSEKDPLILLAKSMERRRCNHHELDEPLSTLECLSSVIDPKKSATNRNRYVVASQEEGVRRFCRGVKGVPLVYVKRSVMILEPMAESTICVKEGIERDKFRTGLRARPGKTKREDQEEGGEDNEDGEEKNNMDMGEGSKEKAAVKKARGAKGPNPLSVKKPKKEKVETQEAGGERSIFSEKKPEDYVENAGGIIEHNADSSQVLSGKRKRKRKHKTGTLEELEHDLAENGERLS